MEWKAQDESRRQEWVRISSATVCQVGGWTLDLELGRPQVKTAQEGEGDSKEVDRKEANLCKTEERHGPSGRKMQLTEAPDSRD